VNQDSIPPDSENTRTFTVPPEGPVFGHYRLGRRLGAGGMGEVYAAVDVNLGRQVALKFLPPSVVADSELKARLLREARSAAALNHPNIVTIFEVGEYDNRPFLAMELVEGETLQARIAVGEIDILQAVDWATQIAEGLSEAHAAGVIHRDIKPSNILVDRKGRIRILDFGLAKLGDAEPLTKAGSTLGTVGYMAPEQVEGKPADHRADIFALGVVLYQSLTGRAPFARDTAAATMYAIVHETPEKITSIRPDIPAALHRVVDRALAKAPAARFQSIEELISDLAKVRDTLRPHPKGNDSGQSIAVLPFADMSPNKDQEYFCDGIAEEIINALTRVQGLRVVSRTSAFQFKGKALDVRDIGLRLGVTAVLEGSVRKSGEKLRVNAQLINVADGMHLWSEKYDRDTSDLFEIQDDISRTIVDTLTSKLMGGSTILVRRTTNNLDAYNLYLEGRFLWNQRTFTGLTRALECFEKALEFDKEYVLAYVGLADALFILFAYNFVDPHTSILRARAAVESALRLDEESAEAYTTLAGIQAYHDWDWKTAEQSFLKALDLNPGYPTAQYWYAELLALTGRFDQSEARFLKALEVDPLSYIINTMYGCFLYRYGQTDKAIERLSNVVKLNAHIDSTRVWLGFALLDAGRKDEALSMLDECVEISGRNPYAIGMRGHGRALVGDIGATQKAFDELKAMPPSTWIAPTLLGVLAWDLDLHSEAYRWFLMANTVRDTEMIFLVLPQYRRLQQDPQVKAFIDAIGLTM
jgi:serine/threonine protein kinase/Tfp pilus assembly protein PilF